MTEVTAVATGLYVNFAIKTDGSLWAWGKNDESQLGDGTTMIRRRPVRVMARGVAAVATGERLAAWAFSSAPPVDLQILPDRNGNGVPELAMLGRTRLPVEVRDGLNGDLIASVAFNSLLEPRDLLIMDDRTGDGIAEVAVLRSAADGKVDLVVQDPVSGCC